jgi:hypothetical protein
MTGHKQYGSQVVGYRRKAVDMARSIQFSSSQNAGLSKREPSTRPEKSGPQQGKNKVQQIKRNLSKPSAQLLN